MIGSEPLDDGDHERLLGGGADVWERYVQSPEVARFLIAEYYHHGRRYDWRELTRRATGRPLESGPFVNDLAGRHDA